MQRTIYLGSAIGILFASFALTLWLTTPERPAPPMIDVLHGRSISNNAELNDAAAAAGWHAAQDMRGKVERINRVNEREVVIGGWLADPAGDATPLDLLVFVAGKLAAKGQTNGERPEVTREMGLAFGSEKNVAFQITFACRTGDQLVVVGLGTAKQYLSLPLQKCP
jgi:hypothetical protein